MAPIALMKAIMMGPIFAACAARLRMHDTQRSSNCLLPLGDKRESPLKIALAIEGATCIETPEQLECFHQWGVRMVALAWAEGSRYAGGDNGGGDVTPAGLKLLEQLDALQCVHDLSHLSERAFWTLLERAKGTKVASHSNCRALLPGAKHPERHLSDPQIKAFAAGGVGGVAGAGGVIGVNLFARFLLPPEELKTRRATTADVVRHMNHIAEVAGTRDCLALGSDMDSGFGPELLPVDLQRPQDLPRLAEALSQANWSDAEIRRFANRWYDVLPVNSD